MCHSAASSRTRVGVVVCFKFNDEDWKLGEIRWMMDLRSEGVTMGVKKLVDAAQNVAIRAVAGAGSGGEYFRALIINCGDGHTDLLSPAAIYDVGTQLVLNW